MFNAAFSVTLRKSTAIYRPCLPALLVSMLFITGVNAQEEDIQARITEIKQQIKMMRSDNERLRAEVSDREEQIAELRRKIGQLDKQLQEMQASL